MSEQSEKIAKKLNTKSLPHSTEAEQSVLAALLLDNNIWDTVSSKITVDEFYIDAHKTLFECMGKLAQNEQPFDAVTISEQLTKIEQLENCGGVAYLSELVVSIPSVDNIDAYIHILLERAIQRKLIIASLDIADTAYQPADLVSEELIEHAEKTIQALGRQNIKANAPQGMKQLLKKAVDRIDLLFNTQGSLTGVSTGFTDLDEMTAGLQPADMVVLAARPSMGKTTMAMNLVENVLLKSTKPTVVFSLEMPAEQLMMRSLSSLALIDQTKIRTGNLSDEDWLKLSSAVERIKNKPLFIDDTPSISPTEVRAKLRNIVREHGELALVMIDYLQLMQISGYKEGRVNEISEISRSLKAIAKEFNVPVIALSQLNRSLEQRPNKRPVNSDLRESGAIEQDADVILFIYRDEVYNPESEHKGVAEIIIGKQRNGPIGTVRLAFLGKYTRFANLEAGTYDHQ